MACEAQKDKHEQSSERVKELAEDLEQTVRRRDAAHQRLDECEDFTTPHCEALFEDWRSEVRLAIIIQGMLEEALQDNINDLNAVNICLSNLHKPVA